MNLAYIKCVIDNIIYDRNISEYIDTNNRISILKHVCYVQSLVLYVECCTLCEIKDTLKNMIVYIIYF